MRIHPNTCAYFLLIPQILLLSSDTRGSTLSDVFARVESRFDHFQSVIHEPEARVAAISAVDKEIDAVMQLPHSLHNAMASISVLPPEILSRIFHFISLDSLSPLECSTTQDLGWIIATHVCRLWRQVAMGDSLLWARIWGVPTNGELVSEMLARARDAPLEIEINLDGASDPKILILFPPHLSHTRELRLRGLDIRHLDSVRDICSQEAPSLEHFEVEVSLNYPTITFRRELDGTTLFKARAPKLRTISLFHIFIPWSFIPRGQLTQLEIYFAYEVLNSDSPLHDDLNQLIDLLANCPDLEILVLDSCLPFQPTHFPYGQIIHLPLLSRLRLCGSGYRITNLLKMLKLPSSTTLQLYCNSENDPHHNHTLLLPVVSAHLQSAVPIEFKGLSVTIRGRDSWLRVSASPSLSKSRICRFQNFESDMEDQFVLSFDGSIRKGLIERVCKMLPISSLEFISISAIDVYGPANWAELFKHCVEVSTIQANGRGTSSLVRALTSQKPPKQDSGDVTLAQSAESTAPPAHTPIFPKLTSLLLKNLDFGETESPGILFDVVQNGLRQRKVAYGTPLKMLCIDDCAINTKRAEALEKHVEKLLWDGEERDAFVDMHDSELLSEVRLEVILDGIVV